MSFLRRRGRRAGHVRSVQILRASSVRPCVLHVPFDAFDRQGKEIELVHLVALVKPALAEAVPPGLPLVVLVAQADDKPVRRALRQPLPVARMVERRPRLLPFAKLPAEDAPGGGDAILPVFHCHVFFSHSQHSPLKLTFCKNRTSW